MSLSTEISEQLHSCVHYCLSFNIRESDPPVPTPWYATYISIPTVHHYILHVNLSYYTCHIIISANF
jgi:hypothetical protein